jgi:hypothetical protein
MGFFLRLVPLAAFAPAFSFAHEVYVLDSASIERALSMTSVNPFSAFRGNEYEFYFWAFVSFVVLSTILCVSVFRFFEKTLDPLFFRLKRLAHPLVRITVAASLVSFGLYGALFGPELSFGELFGSGANAFGILFVLLGAFVLLGVATRIIAVALLGRPVCTHIHRSSRLFSAPFASRKRRVLPRRAL